MNRRVKLDLSHIRAATRVPTTLQVAILTNPAEILQRADHPLVRLLGSDHGLIRLTPASEAMHALSTGNYHAHGSRNRVKSIAPKAIDTPIWRRCYRTAEAPVLPPSVDYLDRIMGRGKQRRTGVAQTA